MIEQYNSNMLTITEIKLYISTSVENIKYHTIPNIQKNDMP